MNNKKNDDNEFNNNHRDIFGHKNQLDIDDGFQGDSDLEDLDMLVK